MYYPKNLGCSAGSAKLPTLAGAGLLASKVSDDFLFGMPESVLARREVTLSQPKTYWYLASGTAGFLPSTCLCPRVK